VLYFEFICDVISIYFLKFIVHEMNSEMVKFRMVMLTGRGNADVTDADMTVGWML
jgi:hypothetical protein